LILFIFIAQNRQLWQIQANFLNRDFAYVKGSYQRASPDRPFYVSLKKALKQRFSLIFKKKHFSPGRKTGSRIRMFDMP